jgi:predicted DNA-binding protein
MLLKTTSVRLSYSLIKEIEDLASALSSSLGFRVTPSDVMRRAIERHIDQLKTEAETEQEEN